MKQLVDVLGTLTALDPPHLYSTTLFYLATLVYNHGIAALGKNLKQRQLRETSSFFASLVGILLQLYLLSYHSSGLCPKKKLTTMTDSTITWSDPANGHASSASNGHTVNNDVPSTNGNHAMNGHNATNGHATAASTATGSPPEPIAICGMACRLPSSIKTPQKLWEFLLAGGDARSKVPESRYNIEAFYDPSGKPGTTKTQHGYFLDGDLANLDTAFFSMPRKEVERIDPQQRLMLEVARECFEDGGEIGRRGKKIGCYVGNLGDDWLEMLAQDTQNFGIYRLSGYGDFALSNRISYEMNLQGPRYVR